MDIGKLDRPIQIEVRSVTRDDYGGEVIGYTTLATVYAEVKYARNTERFEADQLNADTTIRMWIRYRDDFDETARVIYRGEPYNIRAIDEIDRGRYLELTVQKKDGQV